MVSHRARRAWIGLLFLVVTFVALWVPLYNRTEPTLAGMPFFYCFQFGWFVVGGGGVGLGYALCAER
jgi:hypothetical protein